MTHALLSPSRRPRFQLCPGSVREESRYPDESGPAAIDGTHTHSVIEHCLKHGVADPMTLVGSKMTDHDGEFVIDAERAKRAKVATDYVRYRVAVIGTGVRVLTESRVDPAPLVGRSDMPGTVDVQIESPLNLEIIDYKDGINPVPPDDPQLQQYAVGAIAKHGFDRFKTVTLTVIQPKLAIKGGKDTKVINSTSVAVQTVAEWAQDLVREGAAVDDPNAPLVPGEKQCRYCLHRHACSAKANAAMAGVGMLFSPVKQEVSVNAVVEGADAGVHFTAHNLVAAPPVELSQQAAAKNPADMTNDQIREAMEAAPLLRQFLTSVEEEAEKRMLGGQRIAGLKLVNGKGSRKWNLDDDQVVEKLKGMGIPKEACYTMKVISPAQAEKVTWTKRDGTTMQLSERQIKRMDQEYVSHMTGQLIVALESDSRPAVTTDASSLFSAVPQAAPVEALPDFLQTPDWLK